MPEIAIPLLLLDHIEPIEPANSLLGGLEPLSVTSLRIKFSTDEIENGAGKGVREGVRESRNRSRKGGKRGS